MKFIKPILIIIILFSILQSCKNKFKIEKANWFIGDWEKASDEGSFREI